MGGAETLSGALASLAGAGAVWLALGLLALAIAVTLAFTARRDDRDS